MVGCDLSALVKTLICDVGSFTIRGKGGGGAGGGGAAGVLPPF